MILPNSLHCGDNLELLRSMEPQSVDLVLTSPPYSIQRTYGIGYDLNGEEWVAWCVERIIECLRVCKGLVAWNVQSPTDDFQWQAGPALIMADLHRRGVCLRRPAIFHRIGVPGSGSVDWLRNDFEFVICCTNGGRLPWSDNTVMGHPPKWAPGGEMSNRTTDGRRANQWGHSLESGATVVAEDGTIRSEGKRPSHRLAGRDQFGGTATATSGAGRKKNGQHKSRATKTKQQKLDLGAKLHTKAGPDEMGEQVYLPPVLANPGDVIEERYTAEQVAELLEQASDVKKCIVGGGVMGSPLAHLNEAPFPNSLAEFFVRSFCPEGGIVLDCHAGSGTTLAVAERWGRRWIGFDVRESQIALSRRRIKEVELPLFKD